MTENIREVITQNENFLRYEVYTVRYKIMSIFIG